MPFLIGHDFVGVVHEVNFDVVEFTQGVISVAGSDKLTSFIARLYFEPKRQGKIILEIIDEFDITRCKKEQIDRWAGVRHIEESVGQGTRAIAGYDRKIPPLYGADVSYHAQLVEFLTQYVACRSNHVFATSSSKCARRSECKKSIDQLI